MSAKHRSAVPQTPSNATQTPAIGSSASSGTLDAADLRVEFADPDDSAEALAICKPSSDVTTVFSSSPEAATAGAPSRIGDGKSARRADGNPMATTEAVVCLMKVLAAERTTELRQTRLLDRSEFFALLRVSTPAISLVFCVLKGRRVLVSHL